nr:fibronectin type III-like domain-contianing protein [Lachnospiraceae bacterium]
YTEFRQRVTDVSVKGKNVYVKAEVENVGDFPGKEVLFSYISLPEGKLDKALRDLCGYAKTPLLNPGEKCELSISFCISDFASYDEETACFLLEKGDMILSVGNGTEDAKVVAVLFLDETVVTRKTKNTLGIPSFTDIKAPKKQEIMIPDTAVRLLVNPSDFSCENVKYDPYYEIDSRVKALSDEELCFLEIGSFDPNAKGLSIIGNAATHVAGAAGETTSQLENKGIPPLIMADGPAGIRVAKQYYEEDGKAYDADNNGMIPQSMLEMMNPVAKFIAKKLVGGHKMPKDAVVKEHAATMIPIGTAIAQSFNMDLAEKFGDIVGSEMEMMGIHLWLAPALNIHRSILCGRNFEYYSEDPLISGKVAAAITKGVQKHKGCGTTIKHYAANNAETNRYCNNSQVSERAMREIYLRGFEIAVKESQPKAVMTSYNLLNGTHTSEHRGLIEDILRCEFGFKGIVMTDWVIGAVENAKSTYRNALSDEVAKAGGDLFMPGGKKEYERMLQALKNGTVSRKQLEINGTRVVKMAEELNA